MLGSSVPTLAFRFGGSAPAEAEDTGESTKLEADARAGVHDLMLALRPNAPPQAVPKYVHVAALRSGGMSYICLQQGSVSESTLVARKEFIAMGLDVEDPRVRVYTVSPFKRVATASYPLSSPRLNQ